jgi:hypothetical protein
MYCTQYGVIGTSLELGDEAAESRALWPLTTPGTAVVSTRLRTARPSGASNPVAVRDRDFLVGVSPEIVNSMVNSICGDKSNLRNEATSMPDDLGSWGRHAAGTPHF